MMADRRENKMLKSSMVGERKMNQIPLRKPIHGNAFDEATNVSPHKVRLWLKGGSVMSTKKPN
jgi:hypothetical protein